MKKNLPLLFLFFMLSINMVSTKAQNIILVSDDATASQPYSDVLTAAGYTVEIKTDLNVSLGQEQIDALNASDLIVFARNTNSANYNYPDIWNSLEPPVLMLSAFMTRSSRLMWLNSTTVNEADGVEITIRDSTHAIFKGIDSTANPVLINSTAALHTDAIADAGNGTVLAVSATTGNVVIAEWPIGTEFYTGSGQFATGFRAVFFTGLSYDFTETGKTLFLNFVSYMLAPPDNTSVKKEMVKNISFYPSPVENSFTINGDIAPNSTFEIVSLTGQVLLASTVSTNNKVDISNLSSGVYVCKLSNHNQVIARTIIKK
jgi:hypothetical protein